MNGDKRISVLFETEGTYPFVGGGVSTWCNILIEELPQVDYHIYTITGTPNVKWRYERKENIAEIIHIPLWGTEEPAEYILPHDNPSRIHFSTLYRRKKATTDQVIEQEFIPLLLTSLIFSIALLEYTINEFASLIIPVQEAHSAFDVRGHNQCFRRFYLRQIILLILIAIASIIAVYLAVGSLRQYQHLKLVRDFFESPITFFVYWAAAIGYNLMVVGLFSGIFFFSLSRPVPVLRSIIPATVVCAVVGFVLSRAISYEYSAVGMVIGSLVFAVLAVRHALRLMDRLDYFYYSAY